MVGPRSPSKPSPARYKIFETKRVILQQQKVRVLICIPKFGAASRHRRRAHLYCGISEGTAPKLSAVIVLDRDRNTLLDEQTMDHRSTCRSPAPRNTEHCLSLLIHGAANQNNQAQKLV